MKNKIELGIVIPTFNRIGYLSPLLNELHKQIKAIAHNLKVELAVVNDSSSDGTTEYLKVQPPYVHEIKGDGSLWFTRSVNKGAIFILEKMPRAFILILNDDIIVEDTYLKKIYDYLEGSPLAANSIIGPLTITHEKPARMIFSGVIRISVFGRREKYYPSFTAFHAGELTGTRPSSVLPGRGMLFPGEIFRQLNGLDNALYQYHSDEDFCLRARKKGFGVYVNRDWLLFTHHAMTAAVTSYNKVPLRQVFKSFLNKYSRNYIPDRALMVWRHHPKVLFPILVLVNYFLIIRSFLIVRK